VVVFGAERLEAVGRISSFRHDFNKAARSEARRNFCHHGTNFMRTGAVAVQTWSEQGICPGVEFFKLADECVTDLRALETLFDAGTSCKNCDKKITTTVRVSKCLIIVSLKNL